MARVTTKPPLYDYLLVLFQWTVDVLEVMSCH